MLRDANKSESAAASERRFYARSKAFGRFGMRLFKPKIMELAHHHGHVELNFIKGGRLHYELDGKTIVVEPDQLVAFWANMPHQLTRVDGEGEAELCNVYVPLDVFLMMPHLAPLQVELLNGGMVACPKTLCNWDLLLRWYADYRDGGAEHLDILKTEINVLFRRMQSQGLHYLLRPTSPGKTANNLRSSHIRHVVAMIQYVLENLREPFKNNHVTKVTGLHANYALNIFSKAMSIPLKQFVLRMRLLRARSMLLESDLAISSVAEQSGFGSTSQFYAHFSAAYGIAPRKLREKHAAP